MMTTDHGKPTRLDPLGQGMTEPNWDTDTGNGTAPRAALELPDGTTLDHVINQARGGMSSSAADLLQRDVEAIALAPAHALMAERIEHFDLMVDAVAGPSFERAERCRVAVDILGNIALRATPARKGDALLRLPDPTHATPELQAAITAVGMMISGVIEHDHDLVAKADEARAADVAVAREMITVLSIFLAGTWKAQMLLQHQALGSYLAVIERMEELGAPGQQG